MTKQQAYDLLKQAAEKLQDYCVREHGDLNDALAMRIWKALDEDGQL